MVLLILKAGGPLYDIPNGRMDGKRSKIENIINLPAPFFNASQLINMFGQLGFSAQEMVALSGKYVTSFQNDWFYMIMLQISCHSHQD